MSALTGRVVPIDLFESASKRIRSAFSGRCPIRLSVEGFRPAAVLVPLLKRCDGPTILFTRRTDRVDHHKGQISFPGGGLETGEGPRVAALRETHEEVGLDPGRVEIAGELDDYPTVSNYIVTPVVGLVSNPPASFSPAEHEVFESFEVSLTDLLDRTRLRSEWWEVSQMHPEAPVAAFRQLRGRSVERNPETGRYRVYFFDTLTRPDSVIWGLTARILKDLLDRAFDFSL